MTTWGGRTFASRQQKPPDVLQKIGAACRGTQNPGFLTTDYHQLSGPRYSGVTTIWPSKARCSSATKGWNWKSKRSTTDFGSVALFIQNRCVNFGHPLPVDLIIQLNPDQFLDTNPPRIKSGTRRTNRGNPAHGGPEDAPDRKNNGNSMTTFKRRSPS